MARQGETPARQQVTIGNSWSGRIESSSAGVSGKDDVLPWPSQDEFPGFIGYSFAKCEGHVSVYNEGNGLYVRQIFYWKYEENPLNRDFFRMKYKQICRQRPPDCDENLKREIDLPVVSERYFLADKKRKVFVLLGANDCPEETHAPDGSYFKYCRLRQVEEHGWQYHSLNHRLTQFAFNDDNTIISSVDFNKFRSVSADPWSNVNFLMYQPYAAFERHKEIICEQLSPLPANDDLEQWKRFFWSEDTPQKMPLYLSMRRKETGSFDTKGSSMGLSSGNDVPRRTEYQTHFKNVKSISPRGEDFTAELTVKLRWQITKLDIITYLGAGSHRSTWQPGWTPPKFYIHNATNAVIKPGPIVPEVVSDFAAFEDQNSYVAVVAVQILQISGVFSTPFRFDSFPFDTQQLRVELRTSHTDERCVFVNAGCVRKEVNLQMSDWRVAWGHPPKSWDRFVDDDHGLSGNEYQAAHVHGTGVGVPSTEGDVGWYQIMMTATCTREHAMYRNRIIYPMGVFSFLSIGSLSIEHGSDAVDRVMLLVMFVLTATVYAMTISHDLPSLGYLTWMDKYMLASFLFASVVAISIVVLDLCDADDTYNRETASAAVVLWLISQSYFVYTARNAMAAPSGGDFSHLPDHDEGDDSFAEDSDDGSRYEGGDSIADEVELDGHEDDTADECAEQGAVQLALDSEEAETTGGVSSTV
eukprot:m.764125 g.764125  ORF g.764125 m.764125 type:complete len:698 (-) comp23213_c0_seq3:102-2195(-)